MSGDLVAVGALPAEPPRLPEVLAEWDSRSNRLLAALLDPLSEPLQAAIARWGATRVGVVIGCTTSGIADSEPAYGAFERDGAWPASFRYARQELGDPARFAAHMSGAAGPSYVVSTACTSGAKAMVSAALLLEAGLCDAVLCGGIDTLCGLTLNGFCRAGGGLRRALPAVQPQSQRDQHRRGRGPVPARPRARRAAPGGLGRELRCLSPERARSRGRRRRAGDPRGPGRGGPRAARYRLPQPAWHRHDPQRPGRGPGDPAPVRREPSPVARRKA